MKVMNKEKNKNKCRANKDCKLIVFLMMNLKMQGQIVQTIQYLKILILLMSPLIQQMKIIFRDKIIEEVEQEIIIY